MSTREFLLSSWHWNVLGLAGVVVIVLGSGLAKSRNSSGASGRTGGRMLWRVAALGLFVLTQVSPLDTLANGYLFSAHMLQHLLLLLIIPAFLLLSCPSEMPRVGEGKRSETRNLHWLTHPVVGWFAGVAAMWVWHVPRLCDAATLSTSVRGLQMFSLLGLGTLFWWPIIGTTPERRISPLAGVLYLFTACVACTVLGIYITFIPLSVCPAFLHNQGSPELLALIRNRWGISPQTDQQIGGLIMWVPACLIYFSGIMALLLRWHSGEELGAALNAQAAKL